jgi:HD-GYP domain-containing protein (c-di-GMP phosphodiesterase class II)
MDAQLALPLADGSIDAVTRRPRAAAGLPRPPAGAGPRLGELLGALSHALDMGAGQPAGHALRSCWIGGQIGRALGLNAPQLRALHDATLLKDAGCSSNAARLCRLFVADDLGFKRDRRTAGLGLPGLLRFVVAHTGAGAGPAARWRAVLHAVRHGGELQRELTETRCTRGAQIARQLHFGEDVAEAIQCLDEHWDGGGHPQGLAGDEIPLHSRIALLAQTVDVFHAHAGPQAARQAVARRSGRWFDPRLADAFAVLARDPAFWQGLAADDLERRVRALEPAAPPADDDTLDDVALAFGQIADAKSPFTAGHSTRVALAADQIAGQLGLPADARRRLRRAAALHDVGKLGISNTLLDKPGPLDAAEWATMQRHALHTERILGRIGGFGMLARAAGAHHEKLDGSGYPRGLAARHIRLETRIITAADIFDALGCDRPHRPALPPRQVLETMRGMLGTAVDADCFAALQRTRIVAGTR